MLQNIHLKHDYILTFTYYKNIPYILCTQNTVCSTWSTEYFDVIVRHNIGQTLYFCTELTEWRYSQFDSSGEKMKPLHLDAAVIYIHCWPIVQEFKQNALYVPKCHQQLPCPVVCLPCTWALSFVYPFICGLLHGIFSSYTTNTQQTCAQ
jgi:hypothetical protein